MLHKKANRVSINHYNHAIARYMEDTVIEEDEYSNPQLTEKIFNTNRLCICNYSRNKNYDIIISRAFRDIKAYDYISKYLMYFQ